MNALLPMHWDLRKCYFRQNKKQPKHCLDLSHVNTLQPSPKSPIQPPHDFASGPSGKKAERVQVALI